MIIVSAADEKFAPHFATMLHSAWTMHPMAEFHFIDCGLNDSTRAALEDFAAQHSIGLTITALNQNHFSQLPTTRSWSVATYARLMVPYLIPQAQRVLYIDPDAVVVDDLSELWHSDLQGSVVGGVFDRGGSRQAGGMRDYINVGVMVMDLIEWRKGKIGEWAIAYSVQKRPRLLDQDAINATCRGHIHLIDRKWNVMLHEYQRLPDDPRILHWVGPIKPWHYQDAICGSIYLFHRNLTPFSLATAPRVYRSWPRQLINLAIGRPKYWRRLLMHAQVREFVVSHLRSVA